MGGARIRVPVPGQAPGRINFHEDIRYSCFVENPTTQRLFRLLFLSKLWYDEKRSRSVCVCQIACGTKHLASHCYPTVDSCVGTVRHDQLRERGEARALLCWQPDEIRTKVRSILIEIPPKERCHEQRYYGYRLMKTWQFRLQPQVRLIVAIAVDCQIGGLHSHHRANLSRDGLFPSEPLAEHHGFASEQYCWAIEIHRFVDSADAISPWIDIVVDGASTHDLVPGTPRYPCPAKSRIELAAGLVIG